MASQENNEFDESGEAAAEAAPNFNDSSTDEGLVVAEERAPVNRSTLVVFAVLVIGAAGLFVMYRKSGPQSANAAITKETAEAKKTISNFLTTGDAGFKTMETRLKTTEKIVQQFKIYPSAAQVPVSDLQTNPFQLRAKEQKKEVDNTALSAAAEMKRREEQRQSIRKAAEGLSVQSIMCSDTRKACMINNTLYREGQMLDGFMVEKISPSTVLVKNGIYRFELRMQR